MITRQNEEHEKQQWMLRNVERITRARLEQYKASHLR